MTSATTYGASERLRQLAELAANLRWTWHGPTRELFDALGRRLDRPQPTSQEDDAKLLVRLDALVRSRRVATRIGELVTDLRDYLDEPRWYQLAGEVNPDLPANIAYLSLDFDIVGLLGNDSDPQGIIAGDHLKAASDLGVPLVALGLDYRDDPPGAAVAAPRVPRLLSDLPEGVRRRPLLDRHGHPVLVYVDLPRGRTLWARIWRVALGRVELLLLDTDIPNNEGNLRRVTQRRARRGDQDRRLHQDLLIGIGGPQALHAWCGQTGQEYPSVFHCDGDRTAFTGLERIRELLGDRVPIGQAIASARMSTVFTSHVANPLESDYYRDGLLRRHLNTALLEEVPLRVIPELEDSRATGVLNPTDLGFGLATHSTRLALSSNVSASQWSGWTVGHVPDEVVLPGVHGPTWEAGEISRLVKMTDWSGIDLIPDQPELSDHHIWRWHCTLRGRLVRAVQDWLRQDRLRRGATARSLGWIKDGLVPGGLTIGLSCGAQSCQGLGLLLWHPEWLRSLLLDDHQPVQLIIVVPAGTDPAEPAFLDKIQWIGDDVEFRRRVVFVPANEPSLSQLIYSGCDVWLNEPGDGQGHSVFGMRAVLNGALAISFQDGGLVSSGPEDTGWVVPAPAGSRGGDGQLDQQALALFDVLAQHTIPTFHKTENGGLPIRWIEMIRTSLLTVRPRLQASRMVADYVESYYLPAARGGSYALEVKE